MNYADRDYDHCWVCGDDMGVDKLHVMIDNGYHVRHVYCCRRHRYVNVAIGGNGSVARTVVQERSDYEIESLAGAFRRGELQKGWE